tara:strand:+ start:7146 stop:7715 length:570 start_codon:yes stop_codon:yes gene_type:complete
MKSEYIDFIGIYNDAVDTSLCEWIVDYIKRSDQVFPRDYVHIKDKQIGFDAFSPGEARELMGHVDQCLVEYVHKYNYLTNFNFISSVTLLQHTETYGGYHAFHEENTNWDSSSRTMAWMVYLNDVIEGGETEFLYQSMKVRPRTGKVLIWPGGYTHIHRGNPPMSDKFIATGWYQGSMGLRQVNTGAVK